MSASENDATGVQGTSNGQELNDLELLNFPEDVDWSTTLILRCDPEGGPYKLMDLADSLHFIVRRNDVHNLGPTVLNHVFTISFKSEWSTERFVQYLKDRQNKPLTVKGRHCVVSRIPSRCVTLNVRWIPIDVDTVHIVENLKQYGKVIKTDLVQSKKPGWFHVYTGERKFQLLLNDGVYVNDLPYSINIKGLFGAISVAERDPKCLDCYFNGHKGESCKFKGCVLYTGP